MQLSWISYSRGKGTRFPVFDGKEGTLTWNAKKALIAELAWLSSFTGKCFEESKQAMNWPVKKASLSALFVK